MISILFFASGFTALVYELLWIRTLTLVFGTTIYAVSTVLTAFFTGLALGNYYLGRLSDSSRKPLLLYGLLELAIGLYAFLYPMILEGMSPRYLSIENSLESHLATPLIRFLIGMVILVPPSMMMGGTLPVIVKYEAERRGEVGRPLASLYSVNTAGAVVGSLFTGFYLIGAFGVMATMMIAAAINIAIAGVVFFTVADGAERGRVEPSPTLPDRSRETAVPRKNRSERWRVILVVAGVSGFVSLSYEIVWARILVHYTGTTTYAFSTILITFLTGIAIGGYVSRSVLRGRNLWFTLAVVEASIGVSAALSTEVMDSLGRIDLSIASFVVPLVGGSWKAGFVISLVKNSTVMLLPALLMGISLPVAVGIVATRVGSAGSSVGNLFSANTFGAIIGSFAAGFILIPLIGTGWTVTVLVTLNLLLSLLLLLTGPVGGTWRKWGVVTVLLLMISLAFLSRKDLFRTIYKPEKLLFFAEGPSATVAVVTDEDPLNPHYLRMFVDGNGLSGTDYSGRRYMKLLGHLPVILSGGSPENALVICLGTGMTLGAVSLYPSLKHLDCVEISREVVKAADYFSTENCRVLREEKADIIIGDGRNYLLTTPRRYDLITLEPPPPRSAGVVNLYSREFYLMAGDRLTAQGVLCQWIPLHDQSEGDVKALIRTFVDAFPYTTCWLIERNELALVGSVKPQKIQWREYRRVFEEPAVARDLASIDIVDPYDLLSLYLTDERGLREYVGEGDIITDDQPLIEFFLFRWGNRFYRYSPHVRGAYLPVLEKMRTYCGDVRSILEGEDMDDPRGLFAHRKAFHHMVNGTILRNQGREDSARREFLWALRRVEDGGYFKHYAGISDRQFLEAEERFEEDPGNLDAANRLGYIHYMNGDIEKALLVFGRVVEVDPTNVEALINLGMVFEGTGEFGEARRYLERASRHVGEDKATVINARLNDLAFAEAAVVSGDPSRYHEVALMLWRSGRYDEAREWFERTLESRPDWEIVHYNLAATFEVMGRYEDALAHYGRSYELTGSDEAANNIEKLRLFLAIEGDGNGEVELMDGNRISVSWDDPISHNLLGIRYFQNEEYTESISRFVRAFVLKPDYAEALVNAGRAYEEIREYDEAVSCYSRARTIDPSLEGSIARRMRRLETNRSGDDRR